jgi:hypothetical protein
VNFGQVEENISILKQLNGLGQVAFFILFKKSTEQL